MSWLMSISRPFSEALSFDRGRVCVAEGLSMDSALRASARAIDDLPKDHVAPGAPKKSSSELKRAARGGRCDRNSGEKALKRL